MLHGRKKMVHWKIVALLEKLKVSSTVFLTLTDKAKESIMEVDLKLEYDLVKVFAKLGSIFWDRRGIQTNIVALLTFEEFENYVRSKDTPLIILVIIIGSQIEE